MAKSMTKAQLVDHLAKKAGLTKKDTARVLDELAAVAYKQAKTGFTIPVIGIPRSRQACPCSPHETWRPQPRNPGRLSLLPRLSCIGGCLIMAALPPLAFTPTGSHSSRSQRPS